MSAGDDYELIFTVSEEQRGSLETSLASTNVKATCIGQLTGQPGALSLLKNNEKYTPKTGDFLINIDRGNTDFLGDELEKYKEIYRFSPKKSNGWIYRFN